MFFSLIFSSSKLTNAESLQTSLFKVLRNSHENTWTRASFFNKIVDLQHAALLRKRLWHSFFAMNSAKFKEQLFLEHLQRTAKAAKTLFLSLRKKPQFHLISWCGNCAFPLNFQTRKLGEITVLYAVYKI